MPAAVHGADLPAGRSFAKALGAAGIRTHALAGNPLTAARYVLQQRPPSLAGVTSDAEAEAFAIAGMAQGYEMAFLLRGSGQGCSGFAPDPVWNSTIRVAVGAGKGWLGVFADFVRNPELAIPESDIRLRDRTMVSAWLLLPSSGTPRPTV